MSLKYSDLLMREILDRWTKHKVRWSDASYTVQCLRFYSRNFHPLYSCHPFCSHHSVPYSLVRPVMCPYICQFLQPSCQRHFTLVSIYLQTYLHDRSSQVDVEITQFRTIDPSSLYFPTLHSSSRVSTPRTSTLPSHGDKLGYLFNWPMQSLHHCV